MVTAPTPGHVRPDTSGTGSRSSEGRRRNQDLAFITTVVGVARGKWSGLSKN